MIQKSLFQEEIELEGFTYKSSRIIILEINDYGEKGVTTGYILDTHYPILGSFQKPLPGVLKLTVGH